MAEKDFAGEGVALNFANRSWS